MITTKQRAELKGMASLIQPAFQIGKGGGTDRRLSESSRACKNKGA